MWQIQHYDELIPLVINVSVIDFIRLEIKVINTHAKLQKKRVHHHHWVASKVFSDLAYLLLFVYSSVEWTLNSLKLRSECYLKEENEF